MPQAWGLCGSLAQRQSIDPAVTEMLLDWLDPFTTRDEHERAVVWHLGVSLSLDWGIETPEIGQNYHSDGGGGFWLERRWCVHRIWLTLCIFE